MANRVGTGGELAYRSPISHAGSAAVSSSANDDVGGAYAAPRTPKPPLVALESSSRPRKLVLRVTTLLTNQEEGLTVPEMCDRLGETSDAIRAALATLLLSGRVRRLGARRHTRYVLNSDSRESR